MHEINVTPFVDVMLVLLIVFMVTAPLLLSGLPVDLPAVKGQSLNVNKEQLTVTLDSEGRVYLGTSEEPIELGQLAAKLKAIAKEEEAILFRGDRRVHVRARLGGSERRYPGGLQEIHLRKRS